MAKEEKLYICVTHNTVTTKVKGQKPTSQVVEYIFLTGKLRERYQRDSSIIINVSELKMEKDRYPDYTKDQTERALTYIEVLSRRNKDVKKLYDELISYAQQQQELIDNSLN